MSDVHSRLLKIAAAVGLVAAACFALFGSIAMQVSYEQRLLYVASLAAIALFCTFVTSGRAYRLAFAGIFAMLGYVILVDYYRFAAITIGREAMAAFSWSVGTLLIAFLISAHKAQWLPSLGLFPRFDNPSSAIDESKSLVVPGSGDPN